MRKIILELAVSLDGYIEGAKGEIDWCIINDEMGEELNTFIQSIDTVFYGRKSYELYGNYTPGPDSPDSEKQFYQTVHSLKKYVFSTTRNTFEGNATVIQEAVAEKVMEIKRQPGKDIWLFGGASVITSFVNLNLIDEYRVGVHPVVLGSGKALFENIQKRVNLKLIRVRQFDSGVAGLYYQKADG